MEHTSYVSEGHGGIDHGQLTPALLAAPLPGIIGSYDGDDATGDLRKQLYVSTQSCACGRIIIFYHYNYF